LNLPTLHPGTRRASRQLAAAVALLTLALSARLCPARADLSDPVRASHGMVVSQSAIASRIGVEVLRDGGNAIDAAVATAFVLAVTHPAAGNLGGGGFIVYRSAAGSAVAYDFREKAPARAHATMFLKDGRYDADLHHSSHLAVGVPGTVAGLHLAWTEQGRLPWKRLVRPALALAENGFVVSDDLARSLRGAQSKLARSPAALAQFSKQGSPYEAGDVLRQPDLARTLRLIAAQGARGFYEGKVAERIEREMTAHGGLITRADWRAYRALRRDPVRGTYRGIEILSMPPPSSGGVVLIQMLNVLEGYDLKAKGYGSAATVHRMVEAMRRGFAERARCLGDPDFNADLPLEYLLSKDHAAALRQTIDLEQASASTPERFEWTSEPTQTTHLSVVDSARNAVALTTTLEESYGSGLMAPGTGFLLNNEMGDFNAGPGLTTANGSIGTAANLAAPDKRMLSSMSPTILARDGELFLVAGSPGGRTIINTVLETIVNVVDHGMNVQEAVDAPRFHHQWLPDQLVFERYGLSPDTVAALRRLGHALKESKDPLGAVAAIRCGAEPGLLEGAWDRRAPDGAAVGW
jgi:gamma-glutamyltranspeptidase / glutathione hydrolase